MNRLPLSRSPGSGGQPAAGDLNPMISAGSSPIPAPVPGSVDSGAGGGFSPPREIIEAARQETPAGVEAMWLLADLLEPLDPAVTGWDLDVADAELLLFGEVGLGPTDRQLAWFWYTQKVMTGLLGPSDLRTCAVNKAIARRCYSLGRYGVAAAAWQAVMNVHEQGGRWDDADGLRVDWAVCLYGQGRCPEAVTALQLVLIGQGHQCAGLGTKRDWHIDRT